MNLSLTEEQLSLRTIIKDYTKNCIVPTADERDRADVYPVDIIKDMAKLGYTTLTVPQQFRGEGRSKVDLCILMEEVAYGCAATAISLITIFQAQTMLLTFGNEKVKQEYLPMFRDGLVASYSLTEAARGSDIRSVDTKAVKKGDKWVINGKKTFITSGSAVEFFILLAETDKGVSIFAVDRNLPGITIETGEYSQTFGLRNGPHMDAYFTDVILPDYCLIGVEGKGVKQAVTVLNNSRTAAAAISVGIARAAYENSLHWAANRLAFDQKVIDFQGIQWMFTDMLTNINAARLLTYQAAFLLDEGNPAITEASQAKLFAGQMATKVCTDAIQICGAYGTTVNAPFGRYLRDAKAYEIAGGSNEILRNSIGKEITKEFFKKQVV
ncbi:alkylation response protein AidB-like acyl-CoA dehydrogenase [Neobacillus niacini]|uniref:acyl-CoA dehydrogenase family protein n=1 Tax=Neobacillus niacini TaxID=86668 RepID=UPI002782FC44|nr:acyl-CoA dehydrogenase family protein [Neobacillus niacini]MDQ1002220.1 alkylation response protein AidB-like acyl-CoA dehydrogenase [Neobacillus niacini]